MGVNTFRYKLWASGIGAAIGGLSGALYSDRSSLGLADVQYHQLDAVPASGGPRYRATSLA